MPNTADRSKEHRDFANPESDISVENRSNFQACLICKSIVSIENVKHASKLPGVIICVECDDALADLCLVIMPERHLAARITNEAVKVQRSYEKKIADLAKCDCGRKLSPPLCSVCDNDRRFD